MTTQPQPPAAPAEPIAPLILLLRDQRVILDADLARVYGVETRALNQAVRRNLGRFPADFFCQLAPGEKDEVITNCDHLRNLRCAKAFLGSAPHTEKHFAERGIEPDDFAKKRLGQIVFLYFLQKNGWFGVERGQPWGSGNKAFIRHLLTERAQCERRDPVGVSNVPASSPFASIRVHSRSAMPS
jgi:hypothetical protein